MAMQLKLALEDVEDRILAQPGPVTYFAIRLTFAEKLQHLSRAHHTKREESNAMPPTPKLLWPVPSIAGHPLP